MTTIREELFRWRDEDVDAETHITDQEIYILETVVCNIDWIKVINEIIREYEEEK